MLDGLAHGGSTKTRIPPEDFERLDIPVPPLETQRAIVERVQAGRAEIARLRADAERVRRAARAAVAALILGTRPVAGN